MQIESFLLDIAHSIIDGANPNIQIDLDDGRQKFSLSPLQILVHYNICPELIPVLLIYGANVNEYSPNQTHTFIAAAGRKNIDIIKLLTTFGIDVNAKQPIGFSAILSLGNLLQPEVLDFLLHYGYNIHDNETTPFVFSDANEQVCRLLLDYGVDINAKTRDGHSALYLATQLTYQPDKLEFY